MDGLPIQVVNELKSTLVVTSSESTTTTIDTEGEALGGAGDEGDEVAADMGSVRGRKGRGRRRIHSGLGELQSPGVPTNIHSQIPQPNGNALETAITGPVTLAIDNPPPSTEGTASGLAGQPIGATVITSSVAPDTTPTMSTPQTLTESPEPVADQPLPPSEVNPTPEVFNTAVAPTTLSLQDNLQVKPELVADGVKGHSRRSTSWFGSWSRRKTKGRSGFTEAAQSLSQTQEQPGGLEMQEAGCGLGVDHHSSGGGAPPEVIDLTRDPPPATPEQVDVAVPRDLPPESSYRPLEPPQPLPDPASLQVKPLEEVSTQHIPFPTSKPEAEIPKMVVARQASSSKSSWFRSRPPSKEKGKTKELESLDANKRDTEASTPITLEIDPSSTPLQSDTPTSGLKLTLTSQTPASSSTLTLVPPSSAPANTPTPTLTTPVPIAPTTPTDVTSTPASISSVDSEVPPPRSDPIMPSMMLSAETRERTVSISSLNPSSSRFVLRIPLLGRPKIPLEKVVVPAAKGNGKMRAQALSEGDGGGKSGMGREDRLRGDGDVITEGAGPRAEPVLSEPAQPQNPPETPEPCSSEQVPSASQPPEIDGEVQSDVPVIAADELSRPADPPPASDATYSWWGYLGLGAPSPSQAQAQQGPSEEPKKETLTSDRPPTSSSPSTTPAPGSPPVLSTDSELYKAKTDITVTPSGGSALSVPPSSETQGSGSGLESMGGRGAAAAASCSSAADDGRGKEAHSTGDSRSQFNFSKPLFPSSCCSLYSIQLASHRGVINNRKTLSLPSRLLLIRVLVAAAVPT